MAGGVKSEARWNPWASHLVTGGSGSAVMNQMALFHMGCTRGVVALPASISFTVKGKTTILAKETHPKTKFQVHLCCSKKFQR